MILARIADAARRAGRDAAEVQLVAVSKGVSAERLLTAHAAGIDTFGENRVQEAEAKVVAVNGAAWHLVGHLQSNKARRAVELFDAIESVDSIELATRLSALALEHRGGQDLPIYLQVNVDRDPAKAGLDPAFLPAALATISALPGLELRGLMTVGRLVDEPEQARLTFRHLRELSGSLRTDHPGLGNGLSMGMSDDFELAVEEGATVVRVGRALFGERHTG